LGQQRRSSGTRHSSCGPIYSEIGLFSGFVKMDRGMGLKVKARPSQN